MKKDNNTLLSSFEQFTSKNAKILWEFWLSFLLRCRLW